MKENNTLAKEETSGHNAQQQKSHQKDKKTLAIPCKLLWTIFKIDKKGSLRYEQKDQKIDDYAQGLTSKR